MPQVCRVNGSGRTSLQCLLYLGRSRGPRVLVCLDVSGRPFGAGLCVLIIFHRPLDSRHLLRTHWEFGATRSYKKINLDG